MKILNIGGTGNISTSVTRLLAAAGHEVYLLHRNAAASEIPMFIISSAIYMMNRSAGESSRGIGGIV